MKDRDDFVRDMCKAFGIDERVVEEDIRDTEIMRDGVLYADYLESKERKIVFMGREFTGFPAIWPDDSDDIIFGVVTDNPDHDIDTAYEG